MESQLSTGGKNYHPILYQNVLRGNQLDLIFVMYSRYRFDGRPLDREGVCHMIGKEFGREPPRLKDVKIMLNTFDDLEHPLTQKLLSSIEENENELVARADALYHTLTDAGGAFAFQDAITFLSGFTKRIPNPSLEGKRPVWNNEDIPWVKLLLLYPLANFCFDDGLGDQLPEQWCLQIAEANFFHNIKSPRNNVIGVLRDPGQAITKAIAKIMEDQDFPKFFGGKAHGWAKGYELVSQFLRLVLPEPPQGAPFIATTAAFESMSVGAPAPASNEPYPRVPFPENLRSDAELPEREEQRRETRQREEDRSMSREAEKSKKRKRKQPQGKPSDSTKNPRRERTPPPPAPPTRLPYDPTRD